MAATRIIIFGSLFVALQASSPFGLRGMYCTDDFTSPGGMRLVMSFTEYSYEPGSEAQPRTFAIGDVLLYGLGKNMSVVSHKTHYSTTTPQGPNEPNLGLSADVRSFSDAIGADETFLQPGGIYEYSTDVATFGIGSTKETKLDYESCYIILGNENFCSSSRKLKLRFGVNPAGDIVERRLTILHNDEVLTTLEYGFNGTSYPFRLSLVKNKPRQFDKLLTLMDRGTPASTENFWMNGEALAYDPIRSEVKLSIGGGMKDDVFTLC
ncbi:hypothetical protein FOL47_004549 [Perkinsus chesapeaki]|uniref:Uncharacterized protein n=1 Tax=Perkinsus chesapeaki TaxID=330153 RepID=A0A7J6M1V7_PERCH|nr:hypothetical protein FOL47_004549 [Perkinsus chesapeaki]